MLAGEFYISDDPELVAGRLRAAQLCASFNTTPPGAEGQRWRILSELLGAIGPGTFIETPFRCDYGSQISIGARTFSNYGLVALDVCAITIGDDVLIGPNVQLLAATHPTEPERRRAKQELGAPIAIGDNAWLGGGVIVLPGVSIGENSVVGAGAVVTRDIPANVIAAGNPARVLRAL